MTEAGEQEFERLMLEKSAKPIRMFLDFNAVIVNLDNLPTNLQQSCITEIEQNIKILKGHLEENLRQKENNPDIPETGMAVLQQQFILAKAIENWIASLKGTIVS